MYSKVHVVIFFIVCSTIFILINSVPIRGNTPNTDQNVAIADSVAISIAMPKGGNPLAWPTFKYNLDQDIEHQGNAIAVGSTRAQGKQGAVAIQHSNAVTGRGQAIAESKALATTS